MSKNKNIIYDQKVREELKSGVEILKKVVAVTLGPAGRNVLIEKDMEAPISTKDGVTVAKSIKLKDANKNIIIQTLKEAASQTNDAAGDGTTTSTILASEIIQEGLKAMNTNINVVDMCRGIQKGSAFVLDRLKTYTKDISNKKQIEQVAIVSANNDLEIGSLIATAIEKTGKEGVVTVEEGTTPEMALDLVEGMQFNRGYLSPYFITNNATMQVEFENPHILLYDGKLNDASDGFVKLLEKTQVSNRPLLIIADDISGEALPMLIINKVRGGLNIAAVKAPEFGERKTEIMEDLATLTGGTVASKTKMLTFDNIELEHLGTCRLITIDNKKTTIIDGKGDKEKIKERLEQIKVLIDKSQSNYEKERLQERLAKMMGGIAVLKIGANSEFEMKEKKFRVEDALNATRAAIEEGVHPGGGIVLMKIAKEIEGKSMKKYERELKMNKDEMKGFEILLSAMQKPFATIINNAGKNPDTIWEKISRKKVKSVGYDVRSEKVHDMVKAGIIDPKKVTRVALEKAVSISSVLLTTEALVSIDVEEDDAKPNMPNYAQQFMQ